MPENEPGCTLSNPPSPSGMPDERLAEIRRTLEAVTPGQWRWEDWDNAPPRSEPEYLTTLAAPPTSRPNGPSKHYPDLGQQVIRGDFVECAEGDKAFIASAPDFVRELLSEIDRLRSLRVGPSGDQKGESHG